MSGVEGVGRWKVLVAALVGRRNQLVSELARAYQMGPSQPPPPLDADALERHIDSCWMAGGMGGDDEEVGHRRRKQMDPYSRMAKRDEEGRSFQHQSKVEDSSAVQLAVAGLEITPNIVRHILHGQDGLSSPDEDIRVAAALGYVAHIVALLSRYLDVPLRYSLTPAMSTSTLQDYAPLIAPEPEPEEGVLSKGFNALAAALTKPWEMSVHRPGAKDSNRIRLTGGIVEVCQAMDLPLFSDLRGGSDRARFALAVHLLNKDIEQLLQVASRVWVPGPY